MCFLSEKRLIFSRKLALHNAIYRPYDKGSHTKTDKGNKYSYPTEIIGNNAKSVCAYGASEIAETVDDSRNKSRIDFPSHK